MTFTHTRRVFLSAVLAAASLSACSGDSTPVTATEPANSSSAAVTTPSFTGDTVAPALAEAAEKTTASIAVVAGAELFLTAGYPLTGDLDCMTAVIAGLSGVALTCTGETVTGSLVVMSGPTADVTDGGATSVTGNFGGNVEGTEVFRVATLGT